VTRKGFALIAFGLLLGVSVADLGVTLHFNPSLSSEANPLVAQLGLDRFGLIASNALILAVVGIGLILYQRGPRGIPRVPAKNPWAYAGLGLYGRPMSRFAFWKAFLLCWPLPSNWYQFFRFAGFFTAWAILAARVAAVFAWLAIHTLDWTWYLQVREATAVADYPCLELILGLVFGLAMIPAFVLSEFRLDRVGPVRISGQGPDLR